MTASPRVAVVTPLFPSPGAGGVEVFNEQLRSALGDVETFAGDSTASPGTLGRIGLAQPSRAVGPARRFLRRHRQRPFDLVVANGLSGWPLTFSGLDIPAVQVYHLTLAGLARRALSLRGDAWTTGRIAASFDRLAGVGKHVVGVSPRVVREVRSFYHLAARCIPNGVDTSAFVPGDRAAAREALGLPEDRPIGLFVGRPDYSKGYDVLTRVARGMPDVLFLVAGGIAGSDGNIRGVGGVPHDRMPAWYAASDVLVCPSRYEGFNLALVEALACNVPAVVSEAAYALPEEPSGYGVVVPGDDPADFVKAIRAVLAADGAYRPRPLVAARYSLEGFRDAWRSLAASLVGAAAPSPGM